MTSSHKATAPSLACLLTGAALLTAWPPVRALEATADVSYTAEHTSNTTRSEDDEIDEWIHIPGVNVALRQEGAAVEMDAAYRYERRLHSEDVFDDENAATGSAALVWHALPERLDFNLRNTRTESTRRSINPNTEGNRQTVSFTQAGPTLRLRPRSNSELQLEYLFSDVRAEETNTDSERHTGTLRYVVNLSSIRSVTFSGSYNQVDFDNPFAPDLDTTVGSVTFARMGTNIDYALTGGYNRTERDLGRDTVDGPIFEGALTWTGSGGTSVVLEAAHQITDRSSNLLTGGGGLRRVNEDTDLNEVFEENRASISVGWPLGNNQLSLAVQARQEDYEDVGRDSERGDVTLGLSRALDPRTTLTASLQAGRREFTDEGVEQDEYRGSLRLNRDLTRRLGLTLGVAYEEWDADQAGRSYEEWVGTITLAYNLLGAR